MKDEPVTPAAPKTRGRRALGRGLDALLPSSRLGFQELDVNRIERNPGQPRQRFDSDLLKELAESVRQHGVVQPLVVTAIDENRYRLIVGERRWQAAKLAGLKRVPVVVKEASDRQTLELALVENLQREDLNPLEEAAAYDRLIKEFGLTQHKVAEQVGKSRVAVTNAIRLLGLPQTLKTALSEGRITAGHARAILGLSDRQRQMAVLERVERDDLTVRQTEQLVRQLSSAPSPRAKPAGKTSPEIQAMEEELRRSLGFRVRLQSSARGGRIVIEYSSDEELETLYTRLVADNAKT